MPTPLPEIHHAAWSQSGLLVVHPAIYRWLGKVHHAKLDEVSKPRAKRSVTSARFLSPKFDLCIELLMEILILVLLRCTEKLALVRSSTAKASNQVTSGTPDCWLFIPQLQITGAGSDIQSEAGLNVLTLPKSLLGVSFPATTSFSAAST